MWPRSTASETASRWPEEAGVNQLNYRHLYYFWVVAKEGGMARAAQRLDMAIQTISAQVPPEPPRPLQCDVCGWP